MIVHQHPHVFKVKNGEWLKVVAFGDLHWGAPDVAEERFRRQVLDEYADDPLAVFLGMGDIIDGIVPNDAKRYRPSVVKNAYATREDYLDIAIEEFASLWEKYKIPKHRLLGFLSGNHHDAILKRMGTDVTERLCHRLHTRNLGYSCYVKVTMSVRNNNRLPLRIFAHHGFGGGTRTDGGSITKNCRHALRFQGADMYFYGHDHQKWAKRLAIVLPNWDVDEVRDTSIVVAGTGSFKRSVSKGAIPSYSEVAGYPPSELGAIVASARPRTSKHGGRQRLFLEVTAAE